MALGLSASCGPAPAAPSAGPAQTAPVAKSAAAPASQPATGGPAAAPAQQPAAAPASPPPSAGAPEQKAGGAPVPAAAAGQSPRRVFFGTLDQSSCNYPYFVAAAKVINESAAGVNVTVVSTGGTNDNINRAQKGEFELIVMTTQAGYQAYKGQGPWKDKPFADLRWLWIRSVQPIAIVVREDSGIKRLEDLDGKDFNAGQRGASSEVQIKDTLEALGIRPRWYVANAADGLRAVMDRRIVGFAKAMADADALDANIAELMASTKIRVLALTREQAKRVLEKHPYYSFGEIAANVFKDAEWNKEPILSPSIATGGGATKALPEDAAYQIVKAVDEDNQPSGKRLQAAALKGVEKYDFSRLTTESSLFSAPPLHAGAYRWYAERGRRTPDEIIPAEARR